MNALIRKEVRLLLPSWLLGLAIISAPIGVSRMGSPSFSFLLLMAGVLIAMGTALATFGREFGQGTFSSLLALPVSRTRLWWTKVLILAAALLLLYGAWWLSFSICAARWPELRRNAVDNELTLFTSGLILLTVFSGGLWTTLVFRQIASAIWFVVLVPVFLFTLGMALADHLSANPAFHRLMFTGIALGYGIGGFVYAWWLFQRAQDAQWTGGLVALPSWTRWTAPPAERREIKVNRPLVALVCKELQLYHAVLLIAAGFSLLHLAVIIIRKWGGGFPQHPTLSALLGTFWGLWWIMPFLVGAAAVAEERKSGTLESQLCLPIGWRWQLIVKFTTAITLGSLLASLPAWVLEAAQLPSLLDTTWTPLGPLLSMMLFGAMISVVSFYASTLARHTLQAAGIALMLVLVGGFVMSWIEYPELLFRVLLWRGNVAWIIGAPTVGIVLLVLSVRNFRLSLIGGQIWLRNASILAITLVCTLAMASGIYHRVWESVQNSDPRHGPARIGLKEPVRLQQDGNLAVLRAGGQLDVFSRSRFVERTFLERETVSEQRVHADHGTNWISVMSDLLETIAIRADGTLWVSEQSRDLRADSPESSRLVEVGGERWRQVVRDPGGHRSVLLLKTDGTLWRWRETNATNVRKSRLNAPPPYPLGNETNWATLTPFGTRTDFAKTDGTVWSTETAYRRSRADSIDLESGPPPGLTINRQPDLDGIQWRSGTRFRAGDAGVQSDGTLWLMGRIPGNRRKIMERIDAGTDWKAVAGGFNGALALKTDGSLWKLEGGNWTDPPHLRRLSQQSDWVAVAADINMLYAMAADGSIWQWEASEFRSGGFQAAPSRIPVKIASLFPSR
jgi:ABC-type transport system involved in multi-copper enzyme maturation permease subunit